MKSKNILLSALMASILVISTAQAETQATPQAATKEPIKIGELNSYKALPLYIENYRKGWTLALEELNKAGGIHGHKVEVIDRDDLGKPSDALRVATELVEREGVVMLSGCMFANVCLALGDYAEQRKIPVMRWFGTFDDETKRESDYAFALLAASVPPRAAAEYLGGKAPQNWLSAGPNYAYGHKTVKVFEQKIKEQNPTISWPEPFWFPLGKLDVQSLISALQAKKPQAFLSTAFGPDAVSLMREYRKRPVDGLTTIVSIETGMPEFMNTIGAEFPEGWVMTGYPSIDIPDPAHKKFVEDFRKKYAEDPSWMALNGYIAYNLIFDALKKAPDLKPDSIRGALQTAEYQSPVGKVRMRKSDHLSTYGIWVGKSTVVDGKPKLRDWKYYSGDQFLIDETKVRNN